MNDHQHLMLYDLARSRGEQIARDSAGPAALARRELMTTRHNGRRRRVRRALGR